MYVCCVQPAAIQKMLLHVCIYEGAVHATCMRSDSIVLALFVAQLIHICHAYKEHTWHI
jgi:hypothetical protein